MKYILLLLLCLTSVTFAQPHYIAIFDAGSSGTRLQLYKNLIQSNGKLEVTSLEIDGINKINPGISQLKNNTAKINHYLAPLINSLQNTLNKNKIKPQQVDTYFLATAGMRLVDSNKQHAVYTAVKTTLSTAGVHIKKIRTIPGWQEGVFGWISVNTLLGKIQVLSEPTYGFMDLGGASTQITFETHTAQSDNHTHNITIGNHHYQLHSQSFLGLGINEVAKHFSNDASCFPTEYPMQHGNTGHWNLRQCKETIDNVIANFPIPAFSSVNTAPFIGISAFAYVIQSPIFNLNNQLSISSLQHAIEQACQKTWKEFKADDPGDPYTATKCYGAIYVTELITQYGFLPNTTIFTTNEINGVNTSWSYGANIYYASEKQKYFDYRSLKSLRFFEKILHAR